MLSTQPFTDPFLKFDTSFMSCRYKIKLRLLWVLRSKVMLSKMNLNYQRYTDQNVTLLDTHNPEGVMFDLSGEALVFISPPLDAVFTGVVWKDGLTGPHLSATQCEQT